MADPPDEYLVSAFPLVPTGFAGDSFGLLGVTDKLEKASLMRSPMVSETASCVTDGGTGGAGACI